MRKRFVLDTSVLLHDPQAIFKFADNDVLIPVIVLEDIDRFKRDMTERGENARLISRYLDDLRAKGNLNMGVNIEGGGKLYIDLVTEELKKLPVEVSWAKEGQAILLAMMLRLKKEQGTKGSAILVTKDSNLRVKADALQIYVEDYIYESLNVEELCRGAREFEVSSKALDELLERGSMQPPSDFYANEFAVIKGSEEEALVRFDGKSKCIALLKEVKEGAWGVFPKNREQAFALDLLLDDSIKLVTLIGKAGTGKTLLALAAGLVKTIDQGLYKRLLVSRPIFPMGRDIGYLPGDIEMKLNPWMQPIFDNLEFLLGGARTSKSRHVNRSYQELVSRGMLNVEPLTYIRGRSIPFQYLIVDEAQNLTPHEIKTIITRAGEETKVVLTGDIFQIDNPYININTNGLTVVIDKFRTHSVAGHVALLKGERSPLADLATNIL